MFKHPMPALTIDDEGGLVICWSLENGYAEIVLPKDLKLEWAMISRVFDENEGSDSSVIDYKKFIETLNKWVGGKTNE